MIRQYFRILIMDNIRLTKQIAKLRLGSLELKIRSGRFSRSRLEINEHFCAGCTDHNLSNNLEQQFETEYHFIFVCIC